MKQIQKSSKRLSPVEVSPGFTLVELLVTISIIGVLIALVVGSASIAMRKSAESRAQAEMQQLASALEEYRTLFGFYPSFTGEVASAAFSIYRNDLTNATGRIRMTELQFEDPWGNSYQYRNYSRYAYALWSRGPLSSIQEADWIFLSN
ncbi:MAG TPA: type II secretion system protein GspG [Kiritimatiellia bacterium]|nr:type II secretion system protein GspG [Kiritimatiellia bacterium]